MRKVLCSLAVSGMMVFSSGAILAQSDSSTQQQPPPPQSGAMQGGGMHRGMMSPDEQLAHMTKKLNLTSDQQTQIKPILQDHQQQMMALRGDQSMSRQDKMTKMKSINDDSHSKIEAVLNDEQKQKFESMMAKQEQHKMMHGQQGGGTEAPATPPQ